ncbi:MAG: ABC-F family ATP-binding cassette domain-containing protein [Bacteroidetes bacterium]|nr:ABC-F family ATP-binding cassette domain-containing protein [Bacteroidota bacterium]MCB9226192.1 ABC-F family ATP-binding cassette domain-containing protein [Chitinophagales bacterium]
MLRVNNISVEFGGKFLFDDITFQVGDRERVGLTGKNGAGKSTLLKIISNQQRANSGTIETANNYTIGYLPQDIDIDSSLSVIEETRKAFEKVNKLEAEIEDIQHQLVNRTDYESESYLELINQLSEKEHMLHTIGATQNDAEIERVLKGLGFESHEMDIPVNTLSGGWQMRIVLAKILLQKPSLILLDEPTNHLDIESIIWLEEFLVNYEGATILISHDKQFLDNVTTRTIEIVMGKIEDYKCNYSNYLEQRQERIEKQVQAKKNQDEFIKQTERNIEKFRAKATKAKFAQNLMKKLDNLEKIEVDQSDNSLIHFQFQKPPRSGKVVVKAENVQKSYGKKLVLNHLNFEILRGEKIAFVGKNGMGKTTLAKMIVGEIPYKGNLELGHNVSLAFYAQHQAESLDGDRTVLQTIDDAATGDMRTQVRNLLGAFLFSGEDVEKKVKVLSGGEKGRLAMAKLLLEPSNLLVLDEPTNHLDMRSKNQLKKAIQQFEGTVIVVSHDRDFLQGLTDKVFEFKDKGIKEHIGDINEFLRARKASDFRAFELDKKKEEEKTVVKSSVNSKEDYALRKELRSVEGKITTLEEKINQTEEQLKDPEKYQELSKNPAFFKDYEKMKDDLSKLMEQWEEIAVKIEG